MMKNRRTMTKKLAIAAMMMAAAPQVANACCPICGECCESTAANVCNTMDRSSNRFTADSTSYVVFDSDSRYLTQEELSGFSGLYLMLARNEIYAKHGYIFNDQNIQRYFDYKDWYYGYVPSQNFSAAVFNEYKHYNIDLIVAEEARRGGAVASIKWDN